MRTLLLIVLSVLAVAGPEFRAQAAAAPVVTTTAATGVSNSVASLNGTVNPNGSATTAWFEWGLYSANNTNLTTPITVGSGSASVGLSDLLSGLTPGLNYHGLLVASNAFGMVRGLGVQFGAPALTLNGAANLTIGYQSVFFDPGASASGAPLAIAAGYDHSLALKSDGTVAAWGYDYFGQTTIPVGLSNVVAIAGGPYHNLALKRDGTVTAWGDKNFGATSIPVNLSNVVAMAAGAEHSLALKRDGTVAAWGRTSFDQTNIPAGLSNVAAIAAGRYHSLALKNDGTVTAWGYNGYGQTNIPAGLSNVVAIAGGGYHSLALKNDGTIVKWGTGTYYPVDEDDQSFVPVGLSNVVAISAGETHSIALKRDGTVTAWGHNYLGQTTVPVGLSNVVAIAAGGSHNLALMRDGTVSAWGYNGYGQTNIPAGLSNVSVTVAGSVDVNSPGSYILAYTSGNSPIGVATIIRTVVVSTFSLPKVLTLAASGQSNTVASLNGMVNPGGAHTTAWFEWGLSPFSNTNLTTPVTVGNGWASLGLSNPLTRLTPGLNYHGRLVASNEVGVVRGLDVLFGSPALTLNGAANLTIGYQSVFTDPGAIATGAPLAIAAGVHHSLALKSDGTVIAWGYSTYHAYGQTNIPVGLSNVAVIAAGAEYSLALKSDGTVAAWGDNSYGQTTVPVGLSNVAAIAGGYYHSLVLESDGTVITLGRTNPTLTTVPAGLSNVVAIAAGGSHNLALKRDGTVAAWGYNFSGQTDIPAGLSNVVAIAGGNGNSLALKNDGTVVGWGVDVYVNGESTISAGLSNVMAIASGYSHSLALNSDGTVVGWGAGTNYSENFPDYGQSMIPEELDDVVAIAAGAYHSLALKSDGTVAGWGQNFSGQTSIPVGLGDLPVTVVGSVDVNIPGTYTLTYTSSNSLGGVAAPVTRTVVVGPPPTPPLLTGVTRLGDGTFQFSFTNTPGTSFTLFASTNVALPFSSWLNLGTAVEGPAGQYQFTDPAATNSPQRFYGVRSP